MSRDDDFQLRPGRIRSRGAERSRPFLRQVLAAAQRAGGARSGGHAPHRGAPFARGARASVQANRLITRRARGAVIKARVVRSKAGGAPLSRHLSYLRREGVTRDGESAELFGAGADRVDGRAFAERCADDRHHFRFIVSPDDAAEMEDLRCFARDLMAQAEADLGTKLDWVAVDHWNTEHPHLHIIVRGVRADGQDLVIDRDYIRSGLRDRAQHLITQELGPRTEHDIARALDGQIEAERWTDIDRQLVRDAARDGVLDTAPGQDAAPDRYALQKLGRLRKLESFGLAEQIGPGHWIISERAEPTLRELGARNDIIKRIHQGLRAQGLDRAASDYAPGGEEGDAAIIGRLLARGLDDELRGSAFVVIDGVDGRAHHVKLPDLEAAGDSPPGSIVEARRYSDRSGRTRVAIAVRSDLGLDAQITAEGATWLDRQALAGKPIELGGGFGQSVREALDRRGDHLVDQGLARRRAGGRIVFARRLLDRLREREIRTAAEKLSTETGKPYRPTGDGDLVAGVLRQRLDLASGRYAMVDDGLGFQLVPWSPSLQRRLGQEVSGLARGGTSVEWSFGRKRGLAR